MASYRTTIESHLAPVEAFAYMADFANARHWDPSVGDARREGDGEVGLGSTFHVVARFGGRDVALRYVIASFDAPRLVVLEADRPGFVSRDTITIEPSATGSLVHYDARLVFKGLGRIFDPLAQRVFNGVGAKATAGLRVALNP